MNTQIKTSMKKYRNSLLVFLAVILSSGNAASQTENFPGCLDSLIIPEEFGECGSANHCWRIHFPCQPSDFKLSVCNRWGEEIYTTTDYHFIWYGTDQKERELPTGVYVYIIEFTYQGEEKKYKGSVQLQ